MSLSTMVGQNSNNYISRIRYKFNILRHKTPFWVLCLLGIFSVYVSLYAQNQIFTPQIPDADRNQKNKVFLEYADRLSMDERISPDYQVLNGNVKFRKEGMFMYCDSAHFYEKTNSLDAFGNVRMEQGDTLFVYGDVLYYNGDDELAQIRYNVRLENRNVTLFTDSLDYDLNANIGYYMEGGRIVDEKNELSSVFGQYSPDTKNAEFLYDVELVNEQFVLNTDTLKYNTNNHIADIVGPSIIHAQDTTTIYSDLGWYNTDTEESTLFNRSRVVTKDNQVLTGDTIFYDKKKNFGEVFGNMVLTDSVNSSILEGGYGYHDEANKRSFATIRARVMEFSQGDTLFMHGDTIRTFVTSDDSTRIMTAYYKVRFFRKDMQGVADSISFTASDSIMYMYRHPIIWNDNKQVTGNIIMAHLNDSTVDWAKLPEFGFLSEQIGEGHFNQLSGNSMEALFENKDIRQLDVSGNVLALFYPTERDSTYNKLISTESSFLKILFMKREIEKLNMWPEVTGKAIPLFLAKKNDMYLQDFAWHEKIRPKDKDDIFVVPPEMESLLKEPEKVSGRNRKSKPASNTAPAMNQPIAAQEQKTDAETTETDNIEKESDNSVEQQATTEDNNESKTEEEKNNE